MPEQHPIPTTQLSIAECAAIKGVSRKTIRRWIASGLLPAERIGPRLIRVNAADLEQVGRRIPAGRVA